MAEEATPEVKQEAAEVVGEGTMAVVVPPDMLVKELVRQLEQPVKRMIGEAFVQYTQYKGDVETMQKEREASETIFANFDVLGVTTPFRVKNMEELQTLFNDLAQQFQKSSSTEFVIALALAASPGSRMKGGPPSGSVGG